MTGTLRPGVLFDVDGTLCDTNYLHALAWSRALRESGEWAPMNAIHRLVGMGGDQLLPELLGHDSPAALAKRPLRYQELTGDVLAFPRAAEALRNVHERGLVVVLATSAPEDELVTLRKALDADDAIDGQTSADDVDRSKPDPEIFLSAMKRFSIDPRRALAVGDSVWDVKAAPRCRYRVHHRRVRGVQSARAERSRLTPRLPGCGRNDRSVPHQCSCAAEPVATQHRIRAPLTDGAHARSRCREGRTPISPTVPRGTAKRRDSTPSDAPPAFGDGRESHRADPATATRNSSQSALVGALLCLMCFRCGPRFFGFSFLGGYIPLSFGLVLLRPSFATQFIFSSDGSHRFLGLALHIFDNALHSSFGTRVLVLAHSRLLSCFVAVCMPKRRSE